MTIPDHADTAVATGDLTGRQRRIVRRAAIPALAAAILGPIAVTSVAGSPVPDDNLNGHVYLEYALNHRAAETQSLLFILSSLAVAGFVCALGVVHAQRSGRVTFPAVTAIGSAVAFFTLQCISSACNVTIAQLGHGYPSFGADPSAPLVTTMVWDFTNVVVTIGYLPFVVAMCGLAAGNRADPILPRLLAGPIAVLIAGVAGIALIVTLYVDTGAFTPMSTGAGVASVVPINLWLAALAVACLWRTRSARSR